MQYIVGKYMSLFLGNIENKVDLKGRISVPADFRKALKNEEFQGVILFHSFKRNCIEGCSMSRMELMANATDNLDLFSEQQENLTNLLFADARQLTFDVTGRIIIPSDLLKFANITTTAIFVGKGKTFQIWNKENFLKEQTKIREKIKEINPQLSL